MKIEVLYPELCSLYGDLANAEYLARSGGAELVKTPLSAAPRFLTEDIAMVYMGGTTERGQVIVRDAFAPYLEGLQKRTEAGGLTLITGNAMEIFGEYIEDEDGSKEAMLNLFPFHADRHFMNRYNSLYLGKFPDGDRELDIVGFKSQFGHSYGVNDTPLFQTVRGAGINPAEKGEGIRRNNLMATYLIGPLVVLNPPFAKYLLHLMGVAEPELAFEEAAMDVYTHRLEQFSQPERGFIY